MCGGTLLNSNTILTAVNCFDPIPGGGGINYVRLGDHDITTTTNDGASPTDVSIVLILPGWSSYIICKSFRSTGTVRNSLYEMRESTFNEMYQGHEGWRTIVLIITSLNPIVLVFGFTVIIRSMVAPIIDGIPEV